MYAIQIIPKGYCTSSSVSAVRLITSASFEDQPNQILSAGMILKTLPRVKLQPQIGHCLGVL